MYAMRVLKDKFSQIFDALEPGGSGDIYAGLNDIKKAVFEEVTKMGFPTEDDPVGSAIKAINKLLDIMNLSGNIPVSSGSNQKMTADKPTESEQNLFQVL